jgi:hypothetical protein
LVASEISRSCPAAGQIGAAFGFLIWVKANAAEAALIALYVNFGPDGRAKCVDPKEEAMGDIGGLLPPQIPKLRRYARSLVRDITDAENLMQRCRVRALSRQHL